MCWQEIPWYQDPNWLTAIGTIGTVIVALFGVGVYDYLIKPYLLGKRPILGITIIPLRPPDSHQTILSIGNLIKSKNVDAYLLRFRIKNKGKSPIENTEAMVEKLEDDNGTVKDFVPVNLKWSHHDSPTMPMIQRDMFKNCDFISLIQPSQANQAYERPLIPTEYNKFKVVGLLAPVVQTNINPYLEPGKNYCITIKFAGNNVSPQTLIYSFSFYDKWSDNTDEMLTNNIHIAPK